MRSITLALLIVFILGGCKNSKKDDSYIDFTPLVPELCPLPVVSIVHTHNDTLLKIDSNNYIQIPRHAFLNKDNKVVETPIHFYTTVYGSITDIVSRGLQTKDEQNRLLITAGMLEIKAYDSAGEKVFLDKKKPIFLHKHLDNKNHSDFSLYSGLMDSEGEHVWQNPRPNYTPLKPLSFDILFCMDNYDNGGFIPSYMSKQLNLSHYQNTLLATEEFMNRSFYLVAYYSMLSKTENTPESLEKLAKTTVNFFKENINIPLCEIDSIFIRNINTQLTQTPNDRLVSLKENYQKTFMKQKELLGFVNPFDSIPVDTALYNFLYKNDYTLICNQTLNHRNSNTTTKSYKIPFLGWYNIDKLLKDDLLNQNLSVTTAQTFDQVNIILLLEQKRTILKQKMTNGTAIFEAPIPKGKVTVVGIAKKGREMFYTKEKINTVLKNNQVLTFTPISLEQLKEQLKLLDS